MSVAISSSARPDTRQLQANFEALLPRLQGYVRCFFRHLKCTDRKQEALAEATALCWRWYVRLIQKGKDPARFVSILANFAARAVHSGRRLCGQERAQDVLSPRAQQRHDFTTTSLPQGSSLHGNPWDEALHDNMRSAVVDQVCFRLDFPSWRLSRSLRDRDLIDDLMRGEKTMLVARRYGLTAGRISQLRREFHQDWERFCSTPDDLSVNSSS